MPLLKDRLLLMRSLFFELVGLGQIGYPVALRLGSWKHVDRVLRGVPDAIARIFAEPSGTEQNPMKPMSF